MNIKRYIAVVFAMGCLAAFMYGCGEKKAATANQGQVNPGVVEQMMGAEQIKAHQKAKTTLDAVNKERQEQNEEAGL